MSWDSDRFRVEFGQVMIVSLGDGTADLDATYGAEIWLMEDGKVTTRKKRATIIDDSIPALLRMMADWIEENHDTGLRQLVADFETTKTPRPRQDPS